MDIFTLVGKMKLEGADQVKNELDQTAQTAQKTQEKMKMLGAAFTAIGAAGLKMVDSAREMNAQLGMTGITLGKTTKEMRDLALSVTDVSFPLKSVIATFDLLARAGMRNTEDIKRAANAFDALANATGSSAEVIADMLIPVYRAFGQELPKTTEDMDKFTWLTKTTTVDLSDFATVVQRLAPEMQAAGVSMDDAMIALAALEAKGITGRKATMELGGAIARAAENSTDFWTELGLTTDEVVKYRTKLDEATGSTEKYNDMSKTQFGIMDKLKHQFTKLTLVAGSFLTPLEPILALMTALGPVMMFFGTSMGVSAIKTTTHTAALIAHKVAAIASAIAIKAVTAAQWLWNAAMAANPIGLIIIGIMALIAAIVLIVKNWDTVREKTIEIWNAIIGFLKGIWEGIKGIFLGHVTLITEGWNFLVAFFQNIPQVIATAFTYLAEILKAPFLATIQWITEGWNNVVAFFHGIPEAIKKAFTYLKDILIAPFQAAIQWIQDAWAKLVQWVKQAWSFITGKMGSATSTATPAKATPAVAGIAKFQYGGIVPGPIGQPRLVMAEGGERFLGAGVPTPTVGGDTIIVNVQGSILTERQLMAVIREQLLTIKRQNVTTGI